MRFVHAVRLIVIVLVSAVPDCVSWCIHQFLQFLIWILYMQTHFFLYIYIYKKKSVYACVRVQKESRRIHRIILPELKYRHNHLLNRNIYENRSIFSVIIT